MNWLLVANPRPTKQKQTEELNKISISYLSLSHNTN